MKALDLSGRAFGHLTAIHVTRTASKRSRAWLCHCACGATVAVQTGNLVIGHTKSCGCRTGEAISKTKTIHGGARRGRSREEYRIWAGMIRRCHSPTDGAFEYYGGRGIGVCTRWRESFPNFMADIGPRPSAMHSIDRIDNDGNYEPGNCRWATWKQQARNRRTNRRISANGESATLAEWAERLETTSGCIAQRLAKGAAPNIAISVPVRRSAPRGSRKRVTPPMARSEQIKMAVAARVAAVTSRTKERHQKARLSGERCPRWCGQCKKERNALSGEAKMPPQDGELDPATREFTEDR